MLKDQINIWGIVLAVVLFILAAFRVNVGYDYAEYVSIIQDPEALQRFEVGVKGLVHVLNSWGFTDPQYFFVVTSLFVIFFTCIAFCVLSDSWVMSLFLFVFLGAYFNGLNVVRQYMAVPFFLLALYYLSNKEYIRTIFFLLICSMFHISILMIVPWICLAMLPVKKYMYFVCILLSLLLTSFDMTSILQSLSVLLPERYQFYLQSTFASGRSLLGLVKVVFPIILLVIFLAINDLNKYGLRERIFLNLLLFSICLGILFPGNMLVLRIAWYFDIAPVILIPIIYKQLKETKNKTYFTLFVGEYCLCYFILYYLVRNNSAIFPYTFNVEALQLKTLFVIGIFLFLFELMVFFYMLSTRRLKN